MSRKNFSPVDRLHQLYAQIPDANCKGLCTEACSIAPMSAFEANRIAEKHGGAPEPDSRLRCSKLVNGKCSIYADRPMVCRLYGATPLMKCLFGCKPQGGFLREKQARLLLDKAERLV